jgi:peroxiredoxin family protein
VGALSARDAVTLCVFSNDLDKLLAAFSIATGAAACGLRVSMFFTFWGTTLLRREAPQTTGKRLVERMFGWMLPAGPRQLSLSRMHMGGIGRALIGREMRRKGIPALADMIEMAKSSGVEILACSMSMDLMGIRKEELLDYPNLRICGATQFVDMAADGNVTLFV